MFQAFMNRRPSARELHARDNKSLRNARNYRVCLHPLAPADCSPQISACHTIQRRGDGLERIHRRGQVYCYQSDQVELHERQGVLDLSLVGIGRACRFYGFCARHDAALFEPLEKEPFVASQQQIGLMMYRTASRTLWKKRTQIRAEPALRELMVTGSVSQRLTAMQEVDQIVTAQHLGLQVGESIKKSLDTMVIAEDWSSLEWLTLWFDGVLPVMVCASIYPVFDFHGHQLQDFSVAPSPLEVISLFSTASGNEGAFVLAWLRGARGPKILARSLLQLKKQEIPAALLRFVFQFTEDFCVSPSWWDGLPAGQHKLLSCHMNDGMSPDRDYGAQWFDRTRRIDVGARLLRSQWQTARTA